MHRLVVNKRTANYDVYIGRGSKWGNPFTLADYDNNRELVLKLYNQWLHDNKKLLSQLGELTGKVLGCYCAPKKCHGDLLARMSNNPLIVKLYA